MMLSMDDHAPQASRTERTAHETVPYITVTEAAALLHITPGAVRMRVYRGTLASIRVNERTYVLWPQPSQTHPTNVTGTRDTRVGRADDARLVETLQSEVAYLRKRLDAESEARSLADQRIKVLEDSLVSVTGGLMNQTRETRTIEGKAVDAIAAPSHDDTTVMASEPLKPVSDTLALGWRRWWRRITGG